MIESETPRPLLRRLMSAVMVCNPLLLLSPMFLLYGIYRAVGAPNLFATDTSNIIFNFIALAAYVPMVCVTSTLLARKAIIPDTVMLLLLSAMLFVAPFILIAHGVFLPGRLAIFLGVIGCIAGLAHLYVLRRFLPQTFVSRPLYFGGAFVLMANFAGPVIFRHGLESDNEAWGVTAGYAWHFILPLLVAWINFLPATNTGPHPWSRAWFAPVVYLLWLSGTAVQLWTVAYVDDRQLHAHQFTVAIWVLAWTAAYRAERLFNPTYARRLMRIAPICALLLPGAGAIAGLDLRIAATLYVLNLPLLALAHARIPRFALAGISLVGAFCCLPADWIAFIAPATGRLQFSAMIVTGTVIGGLSYLRDSRATFLGAVGVGICVLAAGFSNVAALNMAVLFIFLQQLRWLAFTRDEKILLTITGAVWILQTLSIELRDPSAARLPCFVATVVAALCLRHASLGRVTSLIPPICSIITLTLHPAHWTVQAATAAPSGVVAILGGFAFLAVGAWDSLRQSRRAQASRNAEING